MCMLWGRDGEVEDLAKLGRQRMQKTDFPSTVVTGRIGEALPEWWAKGAS